MKQLLRLFILLVIIFSLVACEQQATKDDEDGVNESAFVLSKISACAIQAPLQSNMLNGYACYADQQLLSSGLVWQSKPIRQAVIQVLRNSDDAILQQTQSNNEGYYEISLASLANNETYRVRVLSEGGFATPASRVLNQNAYVYAMSSSNFSVDAQGVNRDMIASSTVVGQVFNILDQVVDAENYLLSVANVGMAQHIDLVWYDGKASGSYYCPSSCSGGAAVIHLLGHVNDSDGYDDAVILHEYGHFMMDQYSADASPGGTHYLHQTNQDLRLSWSEGAATFFASAVKNWIGEIDPDQYLDTDGQGYALIEYYAEAPRDTYVPSAFSNAVLGIANEVAVTVALWDVLDNNNEENFDSVSEETVLWSVIKSMKNVINVSFQDFWDMWTGGSLSAVVEDRQMYLQADAFEPNDSWQTAKLLDIGLINEQLHSFHSASDLDWVKLSLTSVRAYTIEARKELNGGLVQLTLFDQNGVAVSEGLDVNSSASRLYFTPVNAGDYYVRISHHPDMPSINRYGSYQISYF